MIPDSAEKGVVLFSKQNERGTILLSTKSKTEKGKC
jgi:hypothetical protein